MEVPLDVRLTIESGVLCMNDFGKFHEWAEKLLDAPVWTHEFAMPDTTLNLKIALAIADEGYTPRTRRTKTPIETLEEVAPDKPKIILMTTNQMGG